MRTQSNMSGRHVLPGLGRSPGLGAEFSGYRAGVWDLPPLFSRDCASRSRPSRPYFSFGRQGMPRELILGAGTCIGVGYFSLLFVGMKLGMPPGFAALVSQGQVVFTALFAMSLLGESPSPWQLGGMIVALIGLSLAGLERMGALDSWA